MAKKNKDDGSSGFYAGSRRERPHHPDGWTHKRDATPAPKEPTQPTGGFPAGDPNRGKPK